ncbi:hypothetical protein HQ637_04875 [Enterococcus faecium]|nr:hypothetical protein [Enterococcus faecium]
MIPKFRAWVKPNILSNHLNGVIAEALPNFIYGNCLVLREDLEEDKQFEEIIDFLDIELMQSRERVDKNNIEIFESDIVKNISGGYLGIIVIEDGAFKVKAKHSTFELSDNRCSRMVVVGNIYENPELLEEQR